jgi:hypothetical protein
MHLTVFRLAVARINHCYEVARLGLSTTRANAGTYVTK